MQIFLTHFVSRDLWHNGNLSFVTTVVFIVTCLMLQGFENSQSSVRKATVVCLVAVYLCVGEELRPYLKELNGSKVLGCLNESSFEY